MNLIQVTCSHSDEACLIKVTRTSLIAVVEKVEKVRKTITSFTQWSQRSVYLIFFLHEIEPRCARTTPSIIISAQINTGAHGVFIGFLAYFLIIPSCKFSGNKYFDMNDATRWSSENADSTRKLIN